MNSYEEVSFRERAYLYVLEGQVGLSVLAELLGVDELDDFEAVRTAKTLFEVFDVKLAIVL